VYFHVYDIVSLSKTFNPACIKKCCSNVYDTFLYLEMFLAKLELN